MVGGKLIEMKHQFVLLNIFVFIVLYHNLVYFVTVACFSGELFSWLVLQGNIANVISTIQANKITEDGSQAMQSLMIP